MKDATTFLTADTSELQRRLPNRYGVKWTQFDSEVIPMWIADMDFGVGEAITEALCDAVGGFGLGYSRQSLYDGVIEALVKRYQTKFDTNLDPNLSLLSTDVVQAIYLALSTLSELGEKIVVQSPIYPPFIDAIRDLKREVLYNNLRETEVGFFPDMENLEVLCADQATRVLLLCNPHNPTGRVFTELELNEIAAIAARHHVVVVVDEIHAEIAYAPHRHLPFSKVAAKFGTEYILLTSASKAFNLAGLRCAVANFSSKRLLARYNSLPFHMRGAVSNLGMVGTIAAWNSGDSWLKGVMAQLGSNRTYISEFIAERCAGIGYHQPEGTYLAWLDFGKVTALDDPAERIGEVARVALSHGVTFGPGGTGRARLNFATSSANLQAGLERIAASLPLL